MVVHGEVAGVAVYNHCRDIRRTVAGPDWTLPEVVIAAGTAESSPHPVVDALAAVIEVNHSAGKLRHYPAAGTDSYHNTSSLNSPASPGKYINYNI
jgi:hypothetical protein